MGGERWLPLVPTVLRSGVHCAELRALGTEPIVWSYGKGAEARSFQRTENSWEPEHCRRGIEAEAGKSEWEASLVYTASSRTVRVTERNPVTKNQKSNLNNPPSNKQNQNFQTFNFFFFFVLIKKWSFKKVLWSSSVQPRTCKHSYKKG